MHVYGNRSSMLLLFCVLSSIIFPLLIICKVQHFVLCYTFITSCGCIILSDVLATNIHFKTNWINVKSFEFGDSYLFLWKYSINKQFIQHTTSRNFIIVSIRCQNTHQRGIWITKCSQNFLKYIIRIYGYIKFEMKT